MDASKIAIIAMATVGTIEFFKGFFPSTVPGIIWRIALPFVAIGVSLLPSWALYGVLIVGICQIGYDSVIQGIKKLVANISGQDKVTTVTPNGEAK
jgi:hypothetical protein